MDENYVNIANLVTINEETLANILFIWSRSGDLSQQFNINSFV